MSDNTIRFSCLGDSSYSDYCLDVVTIEHINPDLIVHFGNTCG